LTAARIPAPVPLLFDITVDLRVLAFTAAIAVLATLGFGALPALSASRVDLVRALKGTGGASPRQGRLRSAFLVAQVAMSVLLLVVAGLAVRSFRNARSVDTGFEAANVSTASIDFETRGYPEARALEFIRELVERLEATPGVEAANVVDIVPLTLSNNATRLLRDGDATPAPNQPQPTPLIYTNAVGPGHFRTLRIPLRAGRDFTPQDTAGAPRVAIVNETLARRFWPGQDAIGQRLRSVDAGAPEITQVVGVVRDSKYVTVGEEPRPFLYRPLGQSYVPRVTVLVRAALPPAAVLSTIAREVRAMDSGLAIFGAAPLVEATSISLLPAQLAGALLGAVGMLALALAMLGIYGVLSYLVRSRTREIGIRIAVGASPRTVAAMVIRQALIWTGAGAVIGMALALLSTRFLTVFLYGISPVDPVTFVSVVVLLFGAAAAGAVSPALAASRLDPLTALRSL
jgi:predicted permease